MQCAVNHDIKQNKIIKYALKSTNTDEIGKAKGRGGREKDADGGASKC